MKVKYNNMKGVSAKLDDDELAKLKVKMAELKKLHGAGFSIADMLKVIASTDTNILSELILSSPAGNADITLVKQMDISDQTKALISRAILDDHKKRA